MVTRKARKLAVPDVRETSAQESEHDSWVGMHIDNRGPDCDEELPTEDYRKTALPIEAERTVCPGLEMCPEKLEVCGRCGLLPTEDDSGASPNDSANQSGTRGRAFYAWTRAAKLN